MYRFALVVLLLFVAGSAYSFPLGTSLPLPSLVSAGRFSLSQYELPIETKVVVFFYSASWCAPCKPMAAALQKIYPDLVEGTSALEFVTYSVDRSPRARADYLRETRFAWPAISPEVIEDEPWLKKISAGTPKFQAFRVQGEQLVALTKVGEAEATLEAAFLAIQAEQAE